MTDDTCLMNLEHYDANMIQSEGWRLDRIFEDDKRNSTLVYNKGIEYAKKLSVQCSIGVRTVMHNRSVFVEVYRKKTD